MSIGHLSIAIIGCGPGGLAAAILLSRAGHDVTLYERFSEAKPLGSGLVIQPTGLAVLAHCGLQDAFEAKTALITRLEGFAVDSQRPAVDVYYVRNGKGVAARATHRASLFGVLIDGVRAAGVPIIGGHTFTGVEERAGAITPMFEKSGRGPDFDLLIDASGARGPLVRGRAVELPFGALWATVDMPAGHGLPPQSLNQRYWRASQMAGIMPVGINPTTGNPGAAVFWSVKRDEANAVVAAGVEPIADAFIKLWPEAEPFVTQIRAMEDWTLATYHHRTGWPERGVRHVAIGDSWHSTSPQLGQGANMALLDALAIAQAVEDAGSVEDIGVRFSQLRGFHVALYQKLSWIFTPFFQSDDAVRPVLRDIMMQTFGGWPVLREFIAITVSGRLGLSSLRDL